MAFIIDMNAKIRSSYEEGFFKEFRTVLTSKNLVYYLRNSNLDFLLFSIKGGSTGEILENVLMLNKIPTYLTKINYSTPLESSIEKNNKIEYGFAQNVKLQLNDIDNIKNNFIAKMYSQDIFVLSHNPDFADLTNFFIDRTKKYNKSIILFGNNSIDYTKLGLDYIITNKSEVDRKAPFLIKTKSEFVMFCFSLIEGTETKLFVELKDEIYIFYNNNFYILKKKNTNIIDRLIFAIVLSVKRNLNINEFNNVISYVINNNIYGKQVGEIVENSKNESIGVFHK